MLTKDACIQKYNNYKNTNDGVIPKWKEFLEYANLDKRALEKLFGSSAYSKLQKEAGDDPNILQLERTPFDKIMRQYGNLVAEIGSLPPYAEWAVRGLKPTSAGLAQSPHNMKWSDLPRRFLEWVEESTISGFDDAIRTITKEIPKSADKAENVDKTFLRLVSDVKSWVPARGRNVEETYKVELRNHLENLQYKIQEEFGESKYDLLVYQKYAIETKKSPDQSEYDRLFGQTARHLQHQKNVIVIIFDSTRNDKYENFAKLVDQYFNIGKNAVVIIKK